MNNEMGSRACARQLRTTRKFVVYWRRKFRDVGFHPGNERYTVLIVRHMHVSLCRIYYNTTKYTYVHNIGSWGGARKFAYNAPTQMLAEACVWYLTKHAPYLHLSEYVTHLRRQGIPIEGQSGRMWMCRLFKRWGFSYKLIYYKHVRINIHVSSPSTCPMFAIIPPHLAHEHLDVHVLLRVQTTKGYMNELYTRVCLLVYP
jgi:hypothetical protein